MDQKSKNVVVEKAKPKAPKNKSCSKFALHINQSFLNSEVPKGLIDFNEKKLLKLADECGEEQRKILFLKLVHDYIKGLIAIAWEDGVKPIYVFAQKLSQ